MSYIFHEDILEVSSLNQYKFVSWYCLKVFLKPNKYLIIALWYGRAVIWSNQGIQERRLVLEVRVQRSLLLAFVSLASGIESGNQICIWNSMKWNIFPEGRLVSVCVKTNACSETSTLKITKSCLYFMSLFLVWTGAQGLCCCWFGILFSDTQKWSVMDILIMTSKLQVHSLKFP